MSLSVCDGDINVTIALDDERCPKASYSRPVSESDLQALSLVTRMRQPYAFPIQVRDLAATESLIMLYIVVGVTYVFDRPVSFDENPPSFTFTSQCESRGTYSLDDLVGVYASTHANTVKPVATTERDTYSSAVIDKGETILVQITPFASNTTSCSSVFLNGKGIKLLRASNTSYEYDASSVPEGLSILSVGDVGISLIHRPRKAVFDAPNYVLRHGSARWYDAMLSIFSYNEQLPSDASMVVMSTAIKGSVIFNPHEGNLKRAHFIDNDGPVCSNCPCLKSAVVDDPTPVDACVACDTISHWVRLDDTFRFECTCAKIEYSDGVLCVTDIVTTKRIPLERYTWAHVYLSRGDVTVNGCHRFHISCSPCSESRIKGTVRALCVYRSPLHLRFVELLYKYPDLILQQVVVRYRVMCKWPRRQSSVVSHRFSGLDVAFAQTLVSML